MRESVADWDPLKTRLAFCILPGNIQYIRGNLAWYDFESSELVIIRISRPSINPGSVGQNGPLSWFHRLYGVESNMSL
jgi:hypothetical protein